MPKKKKDGNKAQKKARASIGEESVIVKLRRLPIYWRNMIILSLAGVLAGLVGITLWGWYTGIMVLFFAVSIPLAVYTYEERKRIDDIEKHLPDFLRDLAEYNTSGVPLSQAILEASKTDYGKLTPEIKRIAVEISWGVPFEEALIRFQKRVNSPFVKKAITIMTAAEEQGGEINAILMTLAEDLRRLKTMEEERKGKLSVYTATIYVVFLLLLLVMVMLTTTLAPAIPKIQIAGQLFNQRGGGLSEMDFRTLLFHVSLIEAFFAGLISGQMGEGSVLAGLKHSIILVGITMLVFTFAQPQPPVVKIAESIVEIPPVEGLRMGGLTYQSKFTTGFTTSDIAEKVREIAKNKDMDKYKNFSPTDVVFSALNCNACKTGKIKVTDTTITVNKPVVLSYKVYYANGHYIVELSDVS